MSFSRRIALAASAAVAIAVVLASALTYVLTSNQLHSQVDAQLHRRAAEASAYLRSTHGRLHATGTEEPHSLASLRSRAQIRAAESKKDQQASDLFGHVPPGPDQVRGYQQVVNAKGEVLLQSSDLSLPVNTATRALAARGGAPVYSDARVDGISLRLLAEPFGNARALQFAQPLTEVNSLLSRLRLILVLILIGGIALAALLGRAVAGAALAPLKRLMRATEHVALTQDLSGRIDARGEDELASLARSFNAMLDALERSVRALDASVVAQRQLVADASHELRTPVTSLRTNIELLQAQGAALDPDARRALLDDVVQQIEELTAMTNDLIDLARAEEQHLASEELRLDLLVREVAERARRRSPSTPFRLDLEPTVINGAPERLERAVGNLIDNALKYGAPGAPVEVSLAGHELTVRDHGPGIPPEDLPHIFDRFYRGARSRGRPGSGLGLAIVRQVALKQGGTVVAENANGGGTLMRLRLPRAERLELSGEALPAGHGDGDGLLAPAGRD